MNAHIGSFIDSNLKKEEGDETFKEGFRRFNHTHAKTVLFLLVILLVGAFLRVSANIPRDLHSDEAHYGNLAIEVSEHGNILLDGVFSHKPPLFIWLTAIMFKAFGPTQETLVLANIVVSLLSILAVFGVGTGIGGIRVGLVAACIMALSPLAIAYGPSGFTDPLAGLLGTCAVLFAVRGRWALSGFAMGLTMATKQVGMVFIPLAIAILIFHLSFGKISKERCTRPFNVLAVWFASFFSVMIPLIYWSLVYQVPRLMTFGLSGRPEALDFDIYGSFLRLVNWTQRLRFCFLDSDIISIGYVILLPIVIISCFVSVITKSRRNKQNAFTGIIHLWCFSLLGLFSIGQLPFWNRYLVSPLPILVISLALVIESALKITAMAFRKISGSKIQIEKVPVFLFIIVIALIASPAMLRMHNLLRTDLSADRGGYFFSPAVSLVSPEIFSITQSEENHETDLYHTRFHSQWVWQFYLYGSGVTPSYIDLDSSTQRQLPAMSKTFFLFGSALDAEQISSNGFLCIRSDAASTPQGSLYRCVSERSHEIK